MEDNSRCVYRHQLDDLVLEATVDAEERGHSSERPMVCRVKFHLDGGQGLDADLTRGQIVLMLQLLQAVWTQIGGAVKPTPIDWRDVR